MHDDDEVVDGVRDDDDHIDDEHDDVILHHIGIDVQLLHIDHDDDELLHVVDEHEVADVNEYLLPDIKHHVDTI